MKIGELISAAEYLEEAWQKYGDPRLHDIALLCADAAYELRKQPHSVMLTQAQNRAERAERALLCLLDLVKANDAELYERLLKEKVR